MTCWRTLRTLHQKVARSRTEYRIETYQATSACRLPVCLSFGVILAQHGTGALAKSRPHAHSHIHYRAHLHTKKVKAPPPQYSVLGRPTITATHIDSILCAVSPADHPPVSAACGTGTNLYNLGVKYGIDPVYALAWFQHESSFGRYGVAHLTLSLGNIRCTPGYHCISGLRAYTSWQQCLEDRPVAIGVFHLSLLSLYRDRA